MNNTKNNAIYKKIFKCKSQDNNINYNCHPPPPDN